VPTKKKRQPVQIDGDIMKQLRELSEALDGVPVTNLVRIACKNYLDHHPLRHLAARKARSKAIREGRIAV
jgi:hypothetical protein